MFQFTSTYVVNSTRDSSGKNKFWVDTNPNTGNVTLRMLHGINIPITYTTDELDDEGDKYTIQVFKKAGYEGILATATFTLPAAPAAGDGTQIYRLELDMRLQSGNANSAYARDQVFQGLPIWIEFSVPEGATAVEIQNAALAAVAKYNSDNHYIYFNTGIDTNGDLVLTATQDYVMFAGAELQQYFYNSDAPYPGIVDEYRFVSDAVITPNRIAFGTYESIQRDYRIPTLAANRYTAVNQEELPVPGALYTQYTIHLFSRRGILGTNAVGDLVRSKTTHVLFMPDAVATVFEALLTGEGVTITDAPGYEEPTVTPPTAITLIANPTTYGTNASAISFSVQDQNGATLPITGNQLVLTTDGSVGAGGTPLNITVNSDTLTANIPSGAASTSGDLVFTVTNIATGLTSTATVTFA